MTDSACPCTRGHSPHHVASAFWASVHSAAAPTPREPGTTSTAPATATAAAAVVSARKLVAAVVLRKCCSRRTRHIERERQALDCGQAEKCCPGTLTRGSQTPTEPQLSCQPPGPREHRMDAPRRGATRSPHCDCASACPREAWDRAKDAGNGRAPAGPGPRDAGTARSEQGDPPKATGLCRPLLPAPSPSWAAHGALQGPLRARPQPHAPLSTAHQHPPNTQPTFPGQQCSPWKLRSTSQGCWQGHPAPAS